MLGRRVRRRLSECPSCKSRLYVSRARHVSAILFYVSARGAIIATATANSWRLSQQNPYKTCASLVELGRTSRHFIVHFKKIPTKIILRYGRCALLSFYPIRRDNVVRHYCDVFLGDVSFYLVLEFVLGSSSRSYPPCPKMYRLLLYEYEYQHGIKNPNTVLLLRSISPGT